MLLFKFIAFVVTIEAVTNVILKEEITKKFREALSNYSFFKKMLTCGRCTSFHVMWLLLAISTLFPSYFLEFALWVAAWRLSHIFHDLTDFLHLKRYGNINGN